ncbi:hypothetical protein LF845_10110 [Deferribacterales bacterium Es71-Z0220]|uniref:DUF6701 domain-containing protein n=1 Tax=Deferrivibrio essentukiensis TaxID=2880922 RepID=UPI001F60C8E2|nr:DUF6701 domain-containing protein [Deferrivibrio essentukiensis]MCB4205309.1 hypothetical protein [Deferrivibrio essentukiensis]
MNKNNLLLPILLLVNMLLITNIIYAYDYEVFATNNLSCAGERTNETLNCNAGEFTTIVDILTNGDSTTCIEGQSTTIDIIVTLKDNKAKRYDIGFFVGENNNDPRLQTGSCSVATFDSSKSNSDSWIDIDGDSCSDFEKNGNSTVKVSNVVVSCTDGNSDGTLDIPYTVTYQQNDKKTCNGPNNVSNAKKSKCNYGSASINNIIVIPKPIADYYFDECSWDNDLSTFEVEDSGSNSYDGTSVNGPITVDNDTAGGSIGRVGYFDGVDDYIEIPQAAADILKGTASLSFWIKTSQTGNNTTWAAPSVIGIEQDGGTDDIRWGWIDASGHIGVSKGNNGGNSKSNTRINDNQWHHVILTWNSDNGNIKIYIDGSLDKEGSTDTGVVGNAFNSIGRNENTNSSKSAVYFNGYLDEIKIYDKILTDSQVQSIYNYEKAGKNWDGTDRVKVNCLQLNQCFFDDFNRSSLGTKWTVIKNQNFTPTIEDNKLVLTKKINNVATGVTLAGKFPSQDNYIEIEFEHNAYDNPNGADGVTIALADAAVVDRLLSDNISDIAGAYGGSLGYAQRSGLHGFRGGWLGIGIDEYGNFANDNEGRGKNCQSHPPTYRVKDSITIRGTGDNETGYCFIANSGSLNPGVDNSTAKNYKYKISIDTRNNKTFIKVDRDILDGNGYQTIINWHDATQNATPPDNFKLSITGSTGSVTNIHSFDDLKISALSCGDLGQEIGYKYLLIDAPPTALTCQPADVKITACINDDCSQKYPNGVSGIELSATDGANWTMNPVSIPNGSYSVNTGLYKQTPGTTTLSITSATPSPSDTPIYKCSWDSNCVINFYDSGFIFDIKDTYSYKPQDVTIKAVRKDDQTQACIPAFQNVSLDVSFTFDNLSVNPTNTAPIINSKTVPNNVSLSFDNNGSATFNIVYNEAGRLNFAATFDNGTVKAVGSDSAIFKPFGFYVYTTDTNWEAENGADSSVFKKAGEEFNLSARAVGWQSDTDTDLSDNPITKNYQEDNISVTHTLISPTGGNTGSIGVKEFNFNNGEATVDNQTFSEVGIIKFTVKDDDYLGAGSIEGTSANIGRFIPYNFVIDNINNGTLANQSGNFNYIGQPTTYEDALRPKFTIRAVNKDNQTTTNYRDDFFKLDINGIGLNYPATDNQTKGVDGNYLHISFDKALLTLTKGNGTGEITFGDDNVTYDRNVNTLVNPFTPNFSIEITNANDGELSTDFVDKRVNVTGSTMYFGRLNIHNAYGSELDNVTAEVVTEYYDGSNWKIIEDNTTSVEIGHFILDNFTDNLNSGETTIVGVNSISRGVGEVTLSAPGENNEGSVDLTLDISTAPYYNWLNDIFDNESRGTVTFGIYRGRDRIIDWQEVPAR